MAGAGCWATTAARSGTRRRSRGRRTASQPSSAAKFIELVRRTHPALSTGRDHDLLTFGDVLQRPYGAGKTGREPDGRGLAELIRTTDEIDKLFFRWLANHVGTGWACGTARAASSVRRRHGGKEATGMRVCQRCESR